MMYHHDLISTIELLQTPIVGREDDVEDVDDDDIGTKMNK
jgi:hypothetical protein